MHPIAYNRGNEPIIPNEVNTPVDDDLSSGSSPSLSLSLVKNAENTKAKSHKKPSHHPVFSDAVSGASRRARKEAGRRQNQPDHALGNAPVLSVCTMPPILPAGMMLPMSLVHPAFGTGPTFYMPPVALIRRPNDTLSSALGQHILDYEPHRGFVIPTFTMIDGSADPYDHMLHYN